MTTKTELFAELNDKENRVNSTAHIAVYKDGNGNTSVIVRQHSAPNIWLSNHKSEATTAAAVAKYTTWLNEWVAAQAEAAQAHTEALEEDRQRQIESGSAHNFDPTPAAQQYVEWLTRARQGGAKLVAWSCPACSTELHSLYPAKCGEVWDSATVCPMCAHLYFKITGRHKDGTGHVQLKAL